MLRLDRFPSNASRILLFQDSCYLKISAENDFEHRIRIASQGPRGHDRRVETLFKTYRASSNVWPIPEEQK